MMFTHMINNYINGTYSIEELTAKLELICMALDETKKTEDCINGLEKKAKTKSQRKKSILIKSNRNNENQ